MLIDEIKKRALQAMKAGKSLEKDILRLALGEIQTLEARDNRALSDDEASAVVRKLIKSNQETKEATSDQGQKDTLEQEIAVLETLLPKSLSVEEIVAALAPVTAELKAAGNDGQATGIAMKQLRSAGAVVNGKDVSAAVKQLRAG